MEIFHSGLASIGLADMNKHLNPSAVGLMEVVTFSPQIGIVLILLSLTVFLFATELFRVDVSALIVLVLLGALSYVPGLESLASPMQLFDGFASNAVIAIIAVMILGAGLDKTGLMNKVANWIVNYGGTTERRLIPVISGTVGVISSFMQNVGAAALFIPVVSRISTRTELPLSRLLMPMGFCAILGGTLTMVGSSPLILLNDLMLSANKTLPEEAQLQTFGLFAVTPVGVALVITGILYFMVLGKWVLPASQRSEDGATGRSIRDYLKRLYGLDARIFEVEVPKGNILIGKTLGDVMEVHHLYIIGSYHQGLRTVAPILDTEIRAPCHLAVLGKYEVIAEFVEIYGLNVKKNLKIFKDEFAPSNAGVAEIVIPPDSRAIGKSAKELQFRKALGQNLLAIYRQGDVLSHVETEDHAATRIGLVPLEAGDTLVVQTQWDRLTRLTQDRNYVIVTTDFPQEEHRPQKVRWALLFFIISLVLILATDVILSLCLMLGAVGMILTRVLSIDEAYEAVSWQTVFLLAGLLPLGQAVQNTGTATYIAQNTLQVLGDWPVWGLQAIIAIMATAFSLVMSNVGATVLLVPLAISVAIASGGDPALFALTVAISTSNSFLIPTHQVNALIMGPAGYKVADFMRSGGVMTVLFLIVSMVTMIMFY